MNRKGYVRWMDASKMEDATNDEALVLRPCIREMVGWILHDRPDTLTIAMDRSETSEGDVTWSHVYSIHPRDVLEHTGLEDV